MSKLGSEPEEIRCSACGKRFEHYDDLERHNKEVHDPSAPQVGTHSAESMHQRLSLYHPT
ncbi:MAG: C2H2-type zinc finger protein [Nitrososphaerales archaeon]